MEIVWTISCLCDQEHFSFLSYSTFLRRGQCSKKIFLKDDKIKFLSIPVHEITYILSYENTGLRVSKFLIMTISISSDHPHLSTWNSDLLEFQITSVPNIHFSLSLHLWLV